MMSSDLAFTDLATEIHVQEKNSCIESLARHGAQIHTDKNTLLPVWEAEGNVYIGLVCTPKCIQAFVYYTYSNNTESCE